MTEYHPYDSEPLVMGVDAGGTRIRVAVAGLEGPVLGRGAGGAGNALSVPVPELASHLHEAIARAVHGEDVAKRVRSVVAGFAGAAPLMVDPADVGRERARAALAAACAEAGIAPDVTIEVRSDVEVAFASGAGSAGDGLVLVSGSGAVAGRIAAGRLAWTADGNGRLIDDAGSGFWIGRGAMRAALRALDGRAPWTSLVAAIAERLGVSVEALRGRGGLEAVALRRALIREVTSRGEFYLSTLCPLVTEAAAEGDAVASRILDEAVEELITTLRALRPEPGEPLVTTGGLLAPGGPLLKRLTEAVAALGLTPLPVEDGVAGAIALARG
ncbi:MAG: BadF/BadG/BcrA/BcrD ATPase family protein [Streptosporangiaceae bacterium]|jgi:glucosamine kinase